LLTYQVVDLMKSQASFEFLSLMLVVLFFMLYTFSSATSIQLSARQDEIQRKLNNVCIDISDKINKAVYYGFGFRQNASLPRNIFGVNYTLEIKDNQTLICSTQNSTIRTSIIETFTQTQINNGTNQNPPFQIPIKEIKINNTNGIVMIT